MSSGTETTQKLPDQPDNLMEIRTKSELPLSGMEVPLLVDHPPPMLAVMAVGEEIPRQVHGMSPPEVTVEEVGVVILEEEAAEAVEVAETENRAIQSLKTPTTPLGGEHPRNGS